MGLYIFFLNHPLPVLSLQLPDLCRGINQSLISSAPRPPAQQLQPQRPAANIVTVPPGQISRRLGESKTDQVVLCV